MASGEIDYDGGYPATDRRGDPGTAREVVACFLRHAHRAHRPAEFKSVQELKGKAIGLNTFGGTLESIARLIVKHFGLDPDKDVKFLAHRARLTRVCRDEARLNAADFGSAPLDFLGNKLGFVVIGRANELFSFPPVPVATVKSIKERPMRSSE